MIPPPILYMISPRIVPMGTSIIPALTISPARANTFVPALFSVPNPLYHCEPFRIMGAAFARVSTLLMMVGLSNKPFSKGNGGFCLGSPRFPSMDARREVSSPQTKAPAPMRISRSKENRFPSRSLPGYPLSWPGQWHCPAAPPRWDTLPSHTHTPWKLLWHIRLTSCPR